MSATIPIKFVVQQLDHPVEEHVFEQEMISVGRGRPGKEKKGVDLQLKDPDVARVHCSVHVRNVDDVFVMSMGTAATYLGGNKVKLKEKLASGMVIEIGTSQITVYVGADAMQSHLPTGSVAVSANVGMGEPSAEHLYQDLAASTQDEIPIQSGEYEVMSGQGLPGHGQSSGDSATLGMMAPQSMGGESQVAPVGSAGAAMQTETSGYVLYPMHNEPEGVFGPMGPPPMPLPEKYPPSSLPILLDVADRLGKEVWFQEEKIW